MIQQVLLLGQVLVVVLIYLFVWSVMRSARRDLSPHGAMLYGSSGAAQDSTIISAADAAKARRAAGVVDPRIVVVESDVLRSGVPMTIGEGLRFGRGDSNDVVLDDSYVSTAHAQLLPPGTLVDLESTNGTLVNGAALHGRIRLKSGDTFQLGSTLFRYEGQR